MDKWLDGCVEVTVVTFITLIVLLTVINFVVERCGR